MAKKSTDTNFKCKEWGLMKFSSKNNKMFPGDKMPKMALSWEKWQLVHILGVQYGLLLIRNQQRQILSTKIALN